MLALSLQWLICMATTTIPGETQSDQGQKIRWRKQRHLRHLHIVRHAPAGQSPFVISSLTAASAADAVSVLQPSAISAPP
jgi:hypothetical protein